MSFLLEQQQPRLAPAVAASLGAHLTLAVALFLIVGSAPHRGSATVLLPDALDANIVWLPRQDPGGGGAAAAIG